jgi:hypothetical protein
MLETRLKSKIGVGLPSEYDDVERVLPPSHHPLLVPGPNVIELFTTGIYESL